MTELTTEVMSPAQQEQEVEVFVFQNLDLQDAERQMIHRALERTSNNRKAAAALLGIHARTLRRKLRQYAIEAAPEVTENAA